jgi:CHAT domain-containing protein
LFQRSLTILEPKLGKDHPNVALALNNLALLSARAGEDGKAARLFDRARRVARRHLAAVLPALSEPEKTAFFQNTSARNDVEMALSLGLANKGDASLAALSAEWLLNGKALDQEALASSLLLARQSADPELGKFSRRLLAVRQKLARLTLSESRPGQEKERLKQIEELTDEEQDLGKQLRQAGSKAAPPSWVELADLRKALPKDAVLIDIAHFRPFDFKTRRFQPDRYVAWVTPKSGPVRVIDLGAAEKIDAAIKDFRAAMAGSAKLIKDKGEEHADKAVRQHLDALSKLVLEPLLPHIGKSKRWLVSPDGNLWLLPWEALLLPDGKFALEKYHISYLTSGRDVLPAVAPKVKVTAPLVLADPDFDLDPDKARAEAKRLLGGEGEEGTRSLSGALRLGRVRRLPGTGDEARAITPSLKAHAGVVPRVFTREQALSAVFRSAHSPRVLVLCTHGFFLPDQEVPREEKVGLGKPKAVKKWENPLLRCGLLLAGCNQVGKAAGAEGILTGLEVVGTDLRGCELVVLSACDTGLGEVQVGEGVAGLRQAFQLAGAKAVVSTLWQVPDKQSARLMALFFQNLSKGMTRPDALRSAKLQMIEERREDFAAAHPFFWAAFTLTDGA